MGWVGEDNSWLSTLFVADRFAACAWYGACGAREVKRKRGGPEGGNEGKYRRGQTNDGGASSAPPDAKQAYFSAGQDTELRLPEAQQFCVELLVWPMTPLESPPNERTPVLPATEGVAE